jgi:hypothetical protein
MILYRCRYREESGASSESLAVENDWETVGMGALGVYRYG